MGAEEIGVFMRLLDYGILGLVTIGLGYLGWFLFKKNLDEKDRLQKILEDKLKNDN